MKALKHLKKKIEKSELIFIISPQKFEIFFLSKKTSSKYLKKKMPNITDISNSVDHNYTTYIHHNYYY